MQYATWIALLLSGCTAAGHDQAALMASGERAEVAAVKAEASVAHVDALDASLSATAQRLEAAAVKLDTAVTVGGGGDSVTAWIYAAIAGAALLYPLVWRPIRKRAEAKRSRSPPLLNHSGDVT